MSHQVSSPPPTSPFYTYEGDQVLPIRYLPQGQEASPIVEQPNTYLMDHCPSNGGTGVFHPRKNYLRVFRQTYLSNGFVDPNTLIKADLFICIEPKLQLCPIWQNHQKVSEAVNFIGVFI